MEKEKILWLLAEAAECNYEELVKIPEDGQLSEIGLGSMNMIRFIIAVEEEFHIEVRDSDLLPENFETPQKLFATLEKYFYEKSPVKKAVICDCDNVLWKGAAGEEEISIEAANLELQKELIRLYESGVLLCLCSKNLPENIARAFEHPDMLLRKEHILIFKINYHDKPGNIREIAAELNLTADSFIFVDDSEYEIGLMNAMLPEVTSIRASHQEPGFIRQLDSYFDTTVFNEERTRQYREQKEREKEKVRCRTVEEYNASLSTEYCCRMAEPGEAARIAELSNRTHQFNLSDIHFTEEEILSFFKRDDYSVLLLKASDRYGDMGIVGGAVVAHGSPNIIKGFFLSCRVFDRGFEDIMVEQVKSIFGEELAGIYRETEKNRRFSHFYSDHGVRFYE